MIVTSSTFLFPILTGISFAATVEKSHFSALPLISVKTFSLRIVSFIDLTLPENMDLLVHPTITQNVKTLRCQTNESLPLNKESTSPDITGYSHVTCLPLSPPTVSRQIPTSM